MKNKKAILLPEFLKLVIAVVVIFMLIFLAYQLYNIFIAKSDLEKARETLNQITAKMEGLEEGDEVEYFVTAPYKWVLVGFSRQEDLKISETCKTDYCLCICPETWDYLTESAYQQYKSFQNINIRPNIIEKCVKKGFCKDVNYVVGVPMFFDEIGYLKLRISYPKIPRAIIIEKKEGGILIK